MAMAVFVTVLLPMVLIFWLVIHGGITIWRRYAPSIAYLVAGLAMLLIGSLSWRYKDALIGQDLGTKLVPIIVGAAIYLMMLAASREVRRHLNLRTFAGMPEIENLSTDLILEGPYRYVRHPRYFLVAVGIFGWCLVTNFSGTYLLGAASVLGFLLVAAMEERELLGRFGGAYQEYQNRVPKLFPSVGNLPHIFFPTRKP